MKLNFSGVYPPITTPFNEDESIAWDKLEQNLIKMNSMKLRGYLVQGSNGEYCYLSAEERVEMIRKVNYCKQFISYYFKIKKLIVRIGCRINR